jgi:hypothetical protein
VNIITDVIVAFNTELQERKMRNLAVLETIVKTVLPDHDKNIDFQNNLNDNELEQLANDMETVNLNNLTQEKIN